MNRLQTDQDGMKDSEKDQNLPELHQSQSCNQGRSVNKATEEQSEEMKFQKTGRKNFEMQ